MSSRVPPGHDLSSDDQDVVDERPSLEEPARPARVASGMFLPALIVLAIGVAVILFFALR